ncbi:MAG TPA: hypothetical protein VJH23_03570 [archaeon]|nr:hypothetical protein [archaeon]
MKTRAQVSMEYLVITAFMLVVAGIIFGFALFSFNANSQFTKAQGFVEKVANNADLVASLGEGSAVIFEADIPNGVQAITLAENSVSMSIDLGNGISDITAYARPSLTPASLITGAGRRSFSAAFSDGNVVVTEVG